MSKSKETLQRPGDNDFRRFYYGSKKLEITIENGLATGLMGTVKGRKLKGETRAVYRVAFLWMKELANARQEKIVYEFKPGIKAMFLWAEEVFPLEFGGWDRKKWDDNWHYPHYYKEIHPEDVIE